MSICCIVTLGWGAVQILRGDITETLPQTPKDFKPEIRFIVFTDTHNENENVADAVDTAYALFDNESIYQGVDAFFGLGDFSSIGTESDYEPYIKTLREHIREETFCNNVLDNNEFKTDNYEQLFEKIFHHYINTSRKLTFLLLLVF